MKNKFLKYLKKQFGGTKSEYKHSDEFIQEYLKDENIYKENEIYEFLQANYELDNNEFLRIKLENDLAILQILWEKNNKKHKIKIPYFCIEILRFFFMYSWILYKIFFNYSFPQKRGPLSSSSKNI